MSRLLGKQIGLLLDRQGRVETIILGDASSILIPELSRSRSGSARLRGLRLLHTHLSNVGLSNEDLMDMLFLRLDSVAVLTVDEWGQPLFAQYAHLMPVEDITKPEKAYQLSPIIPWDRLDTDFTALATGLEEEMGRVLADSKQASGDARVILVSVSPLPRSVQENYLDELAELCRTAGLVEAGRLVQRVANVNPRHILGKGKLAELEVLALRGQAALIVFDGELSPAQLQHLAELTERKVLDRTQIILDIFAQHATSRAGKLQVEMAQLKYTQPRLVGKNRAMDRLMGGVGGRGPGETKLETDRRRIRDRITRIKKELEDLRSQRAFTRARRQRQNLPVVALVGYTNAGKSTLLNTLTKSTVLTENKLFATLDPTVRRLRFPEEKEVVLADTVGFIRNLPKELEEAFQATLEELEAADLFLHIVDAAHPEYLAQAQAVEQILEKMKLAHIPRLTLLNKWDSLKTVGTTKPQSNNEEEPELSEETTKSAILHALPQALPISAVTGFGMDEATRRLRALIFGKDGALLLDEQTVWHGSEDVPDSIPDFVDNVQNNVQEESQ